MVRYLAAIEFLLLFSCSICAQSELPAVVVLRDTDSTPIGYDVYHDQAVLLKLNGDELCAIPNLGLSASWTGQNKALVDTVNGRLILIERLFNQVSVFSFDGTRQMTISVDSSPQGVFLTHDAQRIGCVVGKSLTKLETIMVDANTGQESNRFEMGGVAVANDVADSQYWAVSWQIIAFTQEGDIRLRNPLPLVPFDPSNAGNINWCATGVVALPNQDDTQRIIWVAERKHPSKGINRLIAIDVEGQVHRLVDLGKIDPQSIACTPYQADCSRIFIVDGNTGDLVSFSLDGDLIGRDALGVQIVAFGKFSGLWVAGRNSIKRLQPSDLSVLAEHNFDAHGDAIGLAVH